jgi:hypothetical protein
MIRDCRSFSTEFCPVSGLWTPRRGGVAYVLEVRPASCLPELARKIRGHILDALGFDECLPKFAKSV